jgi:hypothetical protein
MIIFGQLQALTGRRLLWDLCTGLSPQRELLLTRVTEYFGLSNTPTLSANGAGLSLSMIAIWLMKQDTINRVDYNRADACV